MELKAGLNIWSHVVKPSILVMHNNHAIKTTVNKFYKNERELMVYKFK